MPLANCFRYLSYIDMVNNLNPTDDETVVINFRVPPKMPSVYATHFFVQETPDEVLLSFFEVIHPIIPPENREDAIKKLKEVGVIAECVSRVVVPKHRFPAFAQAMNETSARMLAHLEELKKQNAFNQSDSTESI